MYGNSPPACLILPPRFVVHTFTYLRSSNTTLLLVFFKLKEHSGVRSEIARTGPKTLGWFFSLCWRSVSPSRCSTLVALVGRIINPESLEDHFRLRQPDEARTAVSEVIFTAICH